MVEIRIDNTGDGTWWLYNNDSWKEYCGCEDFAEEVVLSGNRRLTSYAEAEWYQKAQYVLRDIDCYGEYPEDVSEETKVRLKEFYNKCRCIEDILPDVIRLLNPKEAFFSGTIRGYCQSDWQNYIVKGDVSISMLEALYFGKVASITIIKNDEQFSDIITHDELWNAERIDLKAYLRKRYEIPEGEKVSVWQSDGYNFARLDVNWKLVG